MLDWILVEKNPISFRQAQGTYSRFALMYTPDEYPAASP